MEVYVSLIVKPKTSLKKPLADFFNALHDGNTQDATQASAQLGAETLQAFELIRAHSAFKDYLSTFGRVAVKKTMIEADIVAGSHGFEFAVALMELIGPHCKELTGTFEHDEEPEDEEWPIQLAYSQGEVYANGHLAAYRDVAQGRVGDVETQWASSTVQHALQFDCHFDEADLAASFADLLENRPEQLVEQLQLHAPKDERPEWTLSDPDYVWRYVRRLSVRQQGHKVTGILVIASSQACVWKAVGPGLAPLGASLARVMRLSDEFTYVTGVVHLVDGRIVTVDRYALAGRRGEPLVAALWHDDEPRLRALLADGSAIPAVAFSLAAQAGATYSLALLLAQSPGVLNEPDAHGNTPLVNALIAGQVDAVLQLLAAGAEVNATVYLTPALQALQVMEARLQEVKNAWSYRAVYRYTCEHSMVAEDQSAIEWALSYHQHEAAHLLLDHAPALCWPESDDQLSTVACCIDGGTPALLQRLLEVADSEGHGEPEGEHWLDQAIYLQQYEMAEILLAYGCAINRPNHGDETPLHTATLTHLGLQANQSIPFLLARGAHVDSVDKDGKTPLMCGFSWMAELGETQMWAFHWLLSAGANPRAKDHYGRSVSWHAAEAGFSLKEVLALSKSMPKQQWA